MAFFTSAYKLLAHLAPNWDTQLRTDMQSLEDNLAEASWTPGFGGTGATPGTGASLNGYVTRKGNHVTYFGQIAFGSSPSWGSGTPVVTNFNAYGSNVSAVFSGGTGRLLRAAGGVATPLHMNPGFGGTTGSIFAPVVSSTGSLLTSLSAVQQSDQLIFTLHGILA